MARKKDGKLNLSQDEKVTVSSPANIIQIDTWKRIITSLKKCNPTPNFWEWASAVFISIAFTGGVSIYPLFTIQNTPQWLLHMYIYSSALFLILGITFYYVAKRDKKIIKGNIDDVISEMGAIQKEKWCIGEKGDENDGK